MIIFQKKELVNYLITEQILNECLNTLLTEHHNERMIKQINDPKRYKVHKKLVKNIIIPKSNAMPF